MIFPPAEIVVPGQLLLVTDELPSPADFLVYKIVSVHLKNRVRHANDPCAIICSATSGLTRWKLLAAKSGLDIASSTSSGPFSYLDVAELLQSCVKGGSLRAIYDLLLSTVKAESSSNSDSSNTLMVLDDIASWQWVGVSNEEISRFIRAFAAQCRKLNISLLIRYHVVDPMALDDLMRACLLQLCTYHLDVRPLLSGRSGVVSGEIALHLGPCASLANQIVPRPRNKALQYKLADTNAVFFERGMGGAVI